MRKSNNIFSPSNDKMLGMNSDLANSFLTSVHSTLFSPSMIAMHSRVNFTLFGGVLRALISSRSFFLILKENCV